MTYPKMNFKSYSQDVFKNRQLGVWVLDGDHGERGALAYNERLERSRQLGPGAEPLVKGSRG